MSALHGKWINEGKERSDYRVFRCSCCGNKTLFIAREPSEYCPKCGACMIGHDQREPESIQLINDNDDDSIPMKFIDEFIREYYGKWQATSLGAMLSAWKERKARYVKDENDQEELSEKLEV